MSDGTWILTNHSKRVDWTYRDFLNLRPPAKRFEGPTIYSGRPFLVKVYQQNLTKGRWELRIRDRRQSFLGAIKFIDNPTVHRRLTHMLPKDPDRRKIYIWAIHLEKTILALRLDPVPE